MLAPGRVRQDTAGLLSTIDDLRLIPPCRSMTNSRTPFALSLLALSLYVLVGTGSLVGAGPPVRAQAPEDDAALNLTVGTVGLSIGDSRRTTGLRLNFRDRRLERVTGVNLTLWRPYDETAGVVNGVALGLPLTGAGRMRGVGLGAGLSAQTSLRGVALAPVGVGSGDDLTGVAVGGLGVGAGGRMTGLVVGGLGAGAGDRASGIVVGGLGAGTGGSARGLFLGGLGAGAGENATGLFAGGLAAGAGGDVTGLLVGGLGAGAGERLTGLGVGGVGLGSGDAMTGVFLAGGTLGSSHLTGLSVAGGYVRVEDGPLRGASLSAYNDIRGPQRGLTVGLYNYARELHGLQIGLLNVARNNPVWARVLPGLNLHL